MFSFLFFFSTDNKFMNLTNKTEEDFKEWIINESIISNSFGLNPKCEKELYYIGNHHETIKWDEVPDFMQYEVIKDFARAKGYYIDLQPCPCHFPPQYFINIITEKNKFLDMGSKEEYTYEEGMYASIKEFNNLYNKENYE